MKKTTLDFETRSEVSLKDLGAWKYAAHPSTEVICLAYKSDDGPTWVWFPRKFSAMLPKEHGLPQNHDGSVRRMVRNSDMFEAHNAEFERAIWHHIMHKRLGFEDLVLEKVYCTAARAAMHSLPRSLVGAGSAMGLEIQKDQKGHALMLRMCKPRKALKAERLDMEALGRDPDKVVLWKEDPEDFVRLAQYCIIDTDTEHLLSKKLHELPPMERRVWVMDQKINQRGLPVDIPAITGIIKSVQTHVDLLKKEFSTLCPFAPTQVGKLLGWMDLKGVELPDLTKQTVIDALETDLPQDVRRVLEIRQSVGKSATAKHLALLRMAGADARVRGTLLYHGGHTGRWSGRGFQPQNLYREGYKITKYIIELMREGHLDLIDMLFDNVMVAASKLVRPMVCAPPGLDLIAADLASIEARGLAWLAGEEKVLEIFRGHGKVYEAAAVDVYGGDIEDIGKDSFERQIGKVIILACGYQGHVGAFQSMAATYGVKVPDEEAAKIVNAWRANNQNIVQLWYGLEEVAMNAVKNPSKVTEFRGIKFVVKNGFLFMRLPSGRFLYFCNPGTRMKEFPSKRRLKTTVNGVVAEDREITEYYLKEVITYWGVNDKSQWARMDTYGGKLTENAIQALCRDILAEAMLRIEENEQSPYKLIMHVHDELVVEVPEGQGSVDDVLLQMTINPTWAPDLPITAEGWRGKRYRK